MSLVVKADGKITWKIASMDAGSSHSIYITLQGSFKDPGKGHLTDHWSAKCTSLLGRTKTPKTDELDIKLLSAKK
jgi:hypothetical protein